MLAIFYVFLIVAASYNQNIAYECEDEWFSQRNGSSCYKIHSPVSDYNDAVETCFSMGAQLITIETENENKYISNQMSTNYTAYIGLKKQLPQWIWPNGRTDILDNWKTGQPQEGTCVYLSRSGKWQSATCESSIYGYICERQAQVSSRCAGGWDAYTSASGIGLSCYRIIVTNIFGSTYDHAKTGCSNIGGEIVTIETFAENQFLTSKLQIISNMALIGLRRVTDMWQWSLHHSGTLDKWAADKPTEQHCAYLTKAGTWISVTCEGVDEVNAYICERPTGESVRCADGWNSTSLVSNTSCYKIVIDSFRASYIYGVSTCARQNSFSHVAELVTIETIAENQYLSSLLETSSARAYIGLRRIDGIWQWLSTGTIVLDNWVAGEPKEYDCATIRRDGLWRRGNCHQFQEVDAFICEKPARVSSLLTEDITTEPTWMGDEITTYDLFTQYTLGQRSLQKGDSNIILYVAVPLAVVMLLTIMWIAWRLQIHRLKLQKQKELNEPVQLSQILKNMLGEDIKIKLESILVHRSAIDIQELVGQGAFGLVYRGMYTPVGDSTTTQTVAIKTLKANCIGSQIIGLAEEAGIMANFVHLHILPIIALCIRPEDGVPMLILPYMENGDLRAYLRKFSIDDREAQPPDGKQLMTFCLHIARGMEYLAEQKFVHRDLAARNCMLDNHLIVKIADFGLSRDIYTSSYYRLDQQKCLPVKLLSLESLQFQTFTFHSDVWSFGVTMWEILTLGMMPYTTVENIDMKQHLQSGARLERPEDCSDDMYGLMLSCWDSVAENRPSFGNISKTLAKEMAEISGYMDFNMDPNNYESMRADRPASIMPANSETGQDI